MCILGIDICKPNEKMWNISENTYYNKNRQLFNYILNTKYIILYTVYAGNKSY